MGADDSAIDLSGLHAKKRAVVLQEGRYKDSLTGRYVLGAEYVRRTVYCAWGGGDGVQAGVAAGTVGEEENVGASARGSGVDPEDVDADIKRRAHLASACEWRPMYSICEVLCTRHFRHR